VEGVSDKDYIAHASKHATMQQQRKTNGQLSEAGSSWTVYSAIQNLPAVLNDPFKGKQSNFLTRTWGDGFVEKVDIPKSPYLPEITMQHFEMYLKKIARVIIRFCDECQLFVIVHMAANVILYFTCFFSRGIANIRA